MISWRRGNAAGIVVSLDSRPQRHLALPTAGVY